MSMVIPLSLFTLHQAFQTLGLTWCNAAFCPNEYFPQAPDLQRNCTPDTLYPRNLIFRTGHELQPEFFPFPCRGFERPLFELIVATVPGRGRCSSDAALQQLRLAFKRCQPVGSRRMEKVRFEAELIEGHKPASTSAIVPSDPEERWSQKPVRLDPRRHGWLITGSANGVAFDGYIGERWDRFFIIIDSGLRKAAKVIVGDTLKMMVEPTSSARALEQARAKSKLTTAPKEPRHDAIDPPGNHPLRSH